MVACLLAWCLTGPAAAIGPHELAVIVNSASPDSVAVGEAYAAMRAVPTGNIVRVAIPPRQGRIPFELSPEAFTASIWGPVNRTLRERGLDGQILAWVYAVDIPLRITTEVPMSILGLTFTRNRVPPADAIKDGSYRSALYAGEGVAARPGFAPQSLDTYARWLGDEMPLPAMLLGVTFRGGSTVEQVLAALRRGVASDATHPEGTVYFVTSDDIRSQCRAWQFPQAVRALRTQRVRARITDTFPEGADDVIGLMMGAATVDPGRIGTFLPGAVAEHLTSFAADFPNRHQTKLTAWLDAGATSSSGAVTEPYSIPAKFPAARLFAFYASGCTLIESYAQAIESPLQLVTVGDPLAAPWAPRVAFRLTGLPEGGVLTEPLEVTAVREPGGDRFHVGRAAFLLNGRSVGEGSRIRLDPATLPAGRHDLRFVVWRTGLVQSQVFTRADIEVRP